MAISKIGTDGIVQNANTILCQTSGNVGIGIISPTQKLSVNGGLSFNSNITFTGNGYEIGKDGVSTLCLSGGSSGTRFIDQSTAVEWMRIDSSGNLLVNGTAQFGAGKQCVFFDSTTYVGIALQQTNNSTGTMLSFSNYAGTLQGYINNNNNGTVNYTTSSDYRLKENVGDIENAIETVLKLKPRTFNFKGYTQNLTGFIAHELQAVIPEAVSGEKDAVDKDGNPKYQGVDTSFLVATLTKAIQELNAKIEAQAAEITALKGAA